MTVFTINPYRMGDNWVFDQPEIGLHAEAFVGGASYALDEVLRDLGQFDEAVEKGFTLQFRAGDVNGVIRDPDEDYDAYWSLCDVVLSRVDNPALHYPNNLLFGMEGTWYATHHHSVRQLDDSHVVWLCPALELFFGGKPKRIYMQLNPQLDRPFDHENSTRLAEQDAEAIRRGTLPPEPEPHPRGLNNFVSPAQARTEGKRYGG